MTVEVHVEGRVMSGHMPDFATAIERYQAHQPRMAMPFRTCCWVYPAR
jgi:hypothetical protein